METPEENLPETATVTDSNEAIEALETESPEAAGADVMETIEGGRGENAVAVVSEEYDTKIEAAVTFINDTVAKTIYKGSVLIGDYILKNFFDNDIELAASKNPRKNTSYGKLCEREDLQISPMHLSTMVRVASQERFLSDKGIDTNQLAYTHKASLTKLKDDKQKIELVRECIQGQWSTRELDEKIKDISNQLMTQQRTSLIRETTSYIKAIDKISKLEEPDLNVDQTDISALNTKQRENLGEKLEKLKATAGQSSRKTEAILNYCDTLLDRLSDDHENGQQGGEESAASSEESEE